jgi:hypothetical protein
MLLKRQNGAKLIVYPFESARLLVAVESAFNILNDILNILLYFGLLICKVIFLFESIWPKRSQQTCAEFSMCSQHAEFSTCLSFRS